MATTQAARRDLAVSARRLRGSARERAAGRRAVYDQDADLKVHETPREGRWDAVRVHRSAPVRLPAHDQMSRWLALGSLVLVTFIVALIVLF
jgi:hypothetical protein